MNEVERQQRRMGEQGFVLITSLTIMAIILILGLSMSFLSVVSLQTSSNLKVNTQARYKAEGLLDETIAKLQINKAYVGSGVTNGQGTMITKLTSAGTSAKEEVYTVKAYVSEANNAAYDVVAVVRFPINPLFYYGWSTQGNLDFPANAQIGVDAWTGGSMNGGGNPKFINGHRGIAAGECGRRITNCSDGEAPDVPTPDFNDLRAKARERTGTTSTCPINVSGSKLLSSYTSLLALQSPKVLCLQAGASLDVNVSIPDLTIIDVSNPPSASVKISTAIAPVGNGVGINVFADNVDLGSQTTLSGANTIVSRKSIAFAKGVTSVDNVSRTLIVSTEGDITINGNGGRDINATFWSGGGFRVNGSTGTIKSFIVSKGDINFNGRGGTIEEPEEVENNYIPVSNIAEVISRK